MTQIPAWFVVVMGIGTVFIGLICIVLICSVLGLFFAGKKKAPEAPEKPVEQSKIDAEPLLAAISAAIAVDSGKDPGCVRIISVKKV